MNEVIDPSDARQGSLRFRKKARRRDEIIAVARELFSTKGIDATTMAEIAAAADISPPTVFNYFGSKDGILIAMISEGTAKARAEDRGLHWREGTDLANLIIQLFTRVSMRTLEIADRQVWRYVEAAVIRNPDTELAHEYKAVSLAMTATIAEFLEGIELRSHAGQEISPFYFSSMLQDLWTPAYIELITDDSLSMKEHKKTLRKKLGPFVSLLLTEECIARPRRKDQAA